MTHLVFLDTNVLLYAVTTNPTEAAKRSRAVALMEAAPFAISAQVLAEFYTIATNPRREYLTSAEALGWVMRLAKMPCATTDAALVRDGIEVSERYKISYWDGAIIAAAERLGAKTLYTEDLNDGQIYGAVTARNPFN